MPVTLPNGRQWPTRKEAREYFKAMLGRYRDGAKVSRRSDHGDLMGLLTRYEKHLRTRGKTKIGAGVECFFRHRSPNQPTACFYVRRKDGTTEDFSYIKAITAPID